MVEGPKVVRGNLNVKLGEGMFPHQPRAQSQALGAKRSPAELTNKVQENMTRARDLHMQKTAMSNAQFANTRITSTKAILMKNGKAVCVGFDNPNKNQPNKTQPNNSSETTSLAA